MMLRVLRVPTKKLKVLSSLSSSLLSSSLLSSSISLNTNRYYHIDVTGYPITCSTNTSSSISIIDDVMMSMIYKDANNTNALKDIIANDNTCILAYALLCFEILRNKPINTTNDNDNILKYFDILNSSMNNTPSIYNREKYFSAAALAWYTGEYSRAGSLLETSLLEYPNDTIALKLAQESYIIAGDSRNALGCVARCSHVFDSKHFMHGNTLGMLAAGYVEVGRLVEAEEIAEKAVKITSGRDVWALHTLLNTYQLLGRSSEIIASLEQYQSKDTECIGLQMLYFNKGFALLQRGNYKGALTQFDRILDSMEVDEDTIPCASSLSNATLLLWAISLNTLKPEVSYRWRDEKFVRYWDIVLNSKSSSPIIDICSVIFLVASNMKGVPVEDIPFQSPSRFERQVENNSKKIWKWMTGQKSSESDTSPPKDIDMSTVTTINNTVVEERAPYNGIKFDDHLKNMNQRSTDISINEKYPHLSSLKSLFSIQSRTPESLNSGESDYLWSMKTTIGPIVQGLKSFGDENYLDSARNLNSVRTIYNRIGGTAVQRDVIEQTFIEALLRGESNADAKLLLLERTHLLQMMHNLGDV